MFNTAINHKTLIKELEKHPDNALVFRTGDQTINRGYHVTEVKQASVTSLDCGKGTDSWQEVVIQLLDGKENSSKGYMPTNKFHGIVKAALKDTGDSQLFFEFSPGNGALLKTQIESITVEADQTIVQLTTLAAACKPMLRIMKTGTTGGCC